MEIQKTKGIVLTARSLGEADIACSILTMDYGKRRFIFKGLRKSRKRPLSAKEPGTSLNLVYYFHPDKNRCIISEFSILDAFPQIRNDLEKIYNLSFLLELVERTTADGTGDSRMYNLLEGAVRTLASGKKNMHLSAFFALHMIKQLGLLPDYGICTSCSSAIMGGFYFTIVDLRQICSSCGKGLFGPGSGRNGHGVYIRESVGDFISKSSFKKFGDMDLDAVDERDMTVLLAAIGTFIEQYYHIKLNTLACIAPGAAGVL